LFNLVDTKQLFWHLLRLHGYATKNRRGGGAEIARPDIARPDKTAPHQTAQLNNGGDEQSSP